MLILEKYNGSLSSVRDLRISNQGKGNKLRYKIYE